jgi:hypothetical protein
MFRKSSLVLAAALVCGAAATALAQYNPRFGDDSQQSSYGAIPGVAVPAPVVTQGGGDGRFDDSNQRGYMRDTGMSSFAAQPASGGGGVDGRFDDSNQRGYAR